MSIIYRIKTAFFTALPASLYFAFVMLNGEIRQEYYWISILTGVVVLLGSALVLGFVQPPWLRPKWLWIMAAGFVAMLLALFTIAILDATPLCVGQNNGDGNNDFGMCMGYVILYAVIYGIPYMLMLIVSALIGQQIMKITR